MSHRNTPQAPAALLAELHALRRQNRQLVARLARYGENRRRAQLDRAVNVAMLDALGLITFAVGGGDTGRTTSPLSQVRWARAMGLLRLGRLATGRYNRLQLPADHAETIARVEAAAAVARAHPHRWGAQVPAVARPRMLREQHPFSTSLD